MPTCPNGHHSVAEDWCEVCGHRMHSPGAVPPASPGGGYVPEPALPAELCPQCRTPREAQAPFCEECRYNFLTNSPTTYLPPTPPAPPAAAPQPYPRPFQPQEYQREYQPQGQPPREHQQHNDDWLLPPPSAPVPPGAGFSGGPQQGRPGTWMVAIGPDQEYFAAMMRRSGPEAAQLTLPGHAPEQRLPLSGSQVTIGRRRQSSGAAPDIDLSQPPEDPGVSHQHALLVQQPDGSWAVVDQDSTNGTTVNGSEEPIQPFVPVPLSDGDRVHVGAWTTLRVYWG